MKKDEKKNAKKSYSKHYNNNKIQKYNLTINQLQYTIKFTE